MYAGYIGNFLCLIRSSQDRRPTFIFLAADEIAFRRWKSWYPKVSGISATALDVSFALTSYPGILMVPKVLFLNVSFGEVIAVVKTRIHGYALEESVAASSWCALFFCLASHSSLKGFNPFIIHEMLFSFLFLSRWLTLSAILLPLELSPCSTSSLVFGPSVSQSRRPGAHRLGGMI